MGAEDFGSATSASILGRLASISGVRCTIHTGLPRHSIVIIMPGSTLEMSTSTGAPAARARALGFMLKTNGTATATPATPPIAPVAAMRKRLLPRSTLLSAMFKPAEGYEKQGILSKTSSKSQSCSLNTLLNLRKPTFFSKQSKLLTCGDRGVQEHLNE